MCNEIDVIVIGGGFSGLSVMYYLQKNGYNAKLFEVSGRIGGRAKTDYFEGFTLDRGTHFYHYSTTELAKIIDLKKLDLKNTYPGYLFRYKADFLLYSNPMLKTTDVIPTLFAKNTTLKDKLKLFGFNLKLRATSYANIVKQKDISTYQYFKNNGFSSQTIDTLIRPVISSTIFDRNLQSSSKLSLLYLKSLFNDHVALPKYGIGSIAESIAKELKPASICLKSKVKRVSKNGVEFSNGKVLNAKAIVIATNAIDAKLIKHSIDLNTESTHVSTLYFEAEKAPISKPVMILNANNDGIVSHVFVPTTLHENYAPKGKHLIAVNIVKEHDFDDDELVENTLLELTDWFGLQVKDWHHIKTYHIKYAMPFKPILDDVSFTKHIEDHIFYAGDTLSIGSMETALKSGRETASNVKKYIESLPKLMPINLEKNEFVKPV
jgi:phytoene dehydrogenase-like protein